MPLFEIQGDRLRAVPTTDLRTEGIRERGDLQRLLRDQVDIVAPNTLVLTEEFGDWEDSRRRIDLLALDKQANLVVIELKTEEDGGHMELQALRYAAMVSTMTFENAQSAHAAYLERRGLPGDAGSRILEFLDWPEPGEHEFGAEVRVVLVAPDFSREITTAVMWLNRHDLDIRCVRLQAYKLDGRVVVDVQQIIPLPEAEDYQVRLRQKESEERAAKKAQPTMEDFWRAMETGRPAGEVSAARDLHAWLETIGAKVFPLTAGFAQEIRHGDVPFYFFKVRTDGDVSIWFQYLVKKDPFSATGLREELRQRLCGIPGVDIPPERISGKPRFPLSILSTLR